MKLRKGDKIQITAGKDKGRQGVIERVYAKQDTALVPGLNVYKRHIKKTEQTPEGGLVELPRAIKVSKIALVCPSCKKVTRIGYSISGDKETRICKKCGKKV